MSVTAITEPQWRKNLKPWKPGQSGNPVGMSPERRALVEAIETNCIPKCLELLTAMFEKGLAGDVAAARLWFDQVRGPVKARSDDDAIATAVEQKILEMLSEARQRAQDGSAGGP